MPHCTTNFAWYLGKFIVGFAGMLFLYVGFLKENEYSCLCKPRMREFNRQKGARGERRSDRCQCAEGAQRKVYSCGCKKQTQLNRFSISGCRTMTESREVRQASTLSTPVAAPVGDYNKVDNACVKAESVEHKSRSGIDGNSKLLKSNANLQEEQCPVQYQCCCLRDGSSVIKRRKRQNEVQKPCSNRRTAEADGEPCDLNASNEYTQKVIDNTVPAKSNVEPKTTEKAAQKSQSALIGAQRCSNSRWQEATKNRRCANGTTPSIVKEETPPTTYCEPVNCFPREDQKRVESDSHIILGKHEGTRQQAAPTPTFCTGCRAEENVCTSHPRAKSSKSDQRLDRHESARPNADLLYENTTCIKMKDPNVTKSESKLSVDRGDCRSAQNYEPIDNEGLNERTECCSCCGKRDKSTSRTFRVKRTVKAGRTVFKSSSQSDVDSAGLRNEEFEHFLKSQRLGRTSDRFTSTTTIGAASADDRNFGAATTTGTPTNFAHNTKKYIRPSRLASPSPAPSRESMRNYSSAKLRSAKYNLRQKVSFSRMRTVRRDKLTTLSHDGIHKSPSHQTNIPAPRTEVRKCTCGRSKSPLDETDPRTTSDSSIEVRNMSGATLKQLLQARKRALALNVKSSENEITDGFDSGPGSVCSFSGSFVNSQAENPSQLGRIRGCLCCKRARRRRSYAIPKKTYKNTSSSTSSLNPTRCRSFSTSAYNVLNANQTTNFDTSCTSTCSENVVGTTGLKTLNMRRTSSSSSSASARNMRKSNSNSNDSFLSALKKRIRKHDSPFEMRICKAQRWTDSRRRSKRKRRKAGIIFEGRDEYDSHESMPCCIEYYEEVQNAMLVAHDTGRPLPVLEESDRTVDDAEEEQEDVNLEETSALDPNALSDDSWRRVRFQEDELSQEGELNERECSSELDSERWTRRSDGNRRTFVTVS